jgi:hypothetical protein
VLDVIPSLPLRGGSLSRLGAFLCPRAGGWGRSGQKAWGAQLDQTRLDLMSRQQGRDERDQGAGDAAGRTVGEPERNTGAKRVTSLACGKSGEGERGGCVRMCGR